MTLTRALQIAGVPAERHAQAIASVETAKAACKGLLLHKLKARWFKAGKIADTLAWEDNHLLDVRPDWAELDVAPMENMGCNGDHIPWIHTPDGDRPATQYWLNPDPNSDEYLAAVATNKRYCEGQHPRSKASRKAWYRRNAGEFRAYRMGQPIDPAQGLEIWRGSDKRTDVVVWRASGAWIIKASRQLIGPLRISTRVGFEVDNVYSGDYTPQMWFPIAGYQLRAPVTWSVLPGKAQSMQPKRWEAVRDDGDGKTYTNWTTQ